MNKIEKAEEWVEERSKELGEEYKDLKSDLKHPTIGYLYFSEAVVRIEEIEAEQDILDTIREGLKELKL